MAHHHNKWLVCGITRKSVQLHFNITHVHCVFTFVVACGDARYDFRVRVCLVRLPLLQLFCRNVRVVCMFFVFIYAYWRLEDSNDGISFFVCLFSDISHEIQFKVSMKRKMNLNFNDVWHEHHPVWKSCLTPVCVNKYKEHTYNLINYYSHHMI
jgi:hypothetical protein